LFARVSAIVEEVLGVGQLFWFERCYHLVEECACELEVDTLQRVERFGDIVV